MFFCLSLTTWIFRIPGRSRILAVWFMRMRLAFRHLYSLLLWINRNLCRLIQLRQLQKSIILVILGGSRMFVVAMLLGVACIR